MKKSLLLGPRIIEWKIWFLRCRVGRRSQIQNCGFNRVDKGKISMAKGQKAKFEALSDPPLCKQISPSLFEMNQHKHFLWQTFLPYPSFVGFFPLKIALRRYSKFQRPPSWIICKALLTNDLWRLLGPNFGTFLRWWYGPHTGIFTANFHRESVTLQSKIQSQEYRISRRAWIYRTWS